MEGGGLNRKSESPFFQMDFSREFSTSAQRQIKAKKSSTTRATKQGERLSGFQHRKVNGGNMQILNANEKLSVISYGDRYITNFASSSLSWI